MGLKGKPAVGETKCLPARDTELACGTDEEISRGDSVWDRDHAGS